MSAENVEIVRTLLEDGKSDPAAAVAAFDVEEIKVFPRPSEPGEFEPVEFADAGDRVLPRA